MTVELSEKEIEVIEGWYMSAAGESCGIDESDPYTGLRLLKKLGFEKHSMDYACHSAPLGAAVCFENEADRGKEWVETTKDGDEFRSFSMRYTPGEHRLP
jgi:hypothetical protein